ncbi:Alpha/Beta hydrolase protein [Helicostylum pulchrum]|nr:Alpha/Beta hydrolase protein [Helicostylum pulchrum]
MPIPQGSHSTPIPTGRIRQNQPFPFAPPDRQQSIFSSRTVSPPRKSTGIPRLDVLRESRLHQTYQYKSSSQARLRSHRVGYAEYGPEHGHPVFVIGGYGCTRLVGIMFEEMAFRYDIRMIWPERPGYGLSEECNSRKITALEWADVVIQLSDYLNVRQFSIIAQSVGTVFALAIVHKYKKRILGPIYLISPWVSTQAANTFKWTRRLPAPLVAKTISLALDVMWVFNKSSKSDEDTEDEAGRRSNSSDKKRNPKSRHTILAYEEDELLASLDDDVDLATDFPTNRPLRHFVRPKHMSLYLAMNKRRMSEAYSQGQLCDLMVALEKYHSFGFNYSDVKIPVSAVWGDKDGLIPQKAIEYLASSLHDVRLKILESEGHDLVWKEGVMEWALRGIAERHCKGKLI